MAGTKPGRLAQAAVVIIFGGTLRDRNSRFRFRHPYLLEVAL